MYGLVSEGRKFQLASDRVVHGLLGLTIIVGMPQLFQGSLPILQKVETDLRQAFRLGHWVVSPQTLDVNSTLGHQHTDFVLLSIKGVVDDLTCIVLVHRRKQPFSPIARSEIREVRSRAGTINYIGTAVSPLCAFVACFMQQCIPEMKVQGLKMDNRMIKDLKGRPTTICYYKTTEEER